MCTEKELNQRLERTQKELEVFLEAISTLNCSLDIKEILGRLMFLLHKIVALGSCQLFVMDKGTVMFEVDSHFAEEPCESVFNTVEYLQQVKKVYQEGTCCKYEGSNWEYFIPMCNGEEVQGVIHIVLEQNTCLDDYQERLLWHLARQGALVIKNAKLFEEVKRLATVDGLTGLYNRQYFQEVFPKETARAWRQGQPLSLIMLDVNGLKAVNDHYGHLEGDILICGAAQVVKKSVRNIDYVFRYGGDELLILLVDAGPAVAQTVMKRIDKMQAAWNQTANKPYRLSLSMGCASGSSSEEFEGLLTQADQGMYRHKENFYQAKREVFTDGTGALD